MKEFLKDMLIEPFTDGDWMGYILGGLMWILTIAIVGGLLWLSVWLIDSSFLPLKEKEGVVTEHYYVPAHTTTTYVMSGKVMIPITNYIDDSYEITVEIDGLTDNVCLYQSNWSEIKVGDKFCFNYTNGRICKTLYIKSFCGEEKK
jgi:hypothetical protein